MAHTIIPVGCQTAKSMQKGPAPEPRTSDPARAVAAFRLDLPWAAAIFQTQSYHFNHSICHHFKTVPTHILTYPCFMFNKMGRSKHFVFTFLFFHIFGPSSRIPRIAGERGLCISVLIHTLQGIPEGYPGSFFLPTNVSGPIILSFSERTPKPFSIKVCSSNARRLSEVSCGSLRPCGIVTEFNRHRGPRPHVHVDVDPEGHLVAPGAPRGRCAFRLCPSPLICHRSINFRKCRP